MKQCRGIWLPDHEEHLQSHIQSGPLVGGLGTYQLHKIELALTHTKGRRLAIDIGAHVGLISRILATQFEQVEAFEPRPDHQDCWMRNIKAGNVRLHRCGLGATAGDARMLSVKGNSGHSHLAENGDIIVPIRTLDEFAFEEVDFVKIDTEGYEREIVLGAVDTLQRCKPTMMVEQKANNGSRYGHGDHGALELLGKLGAKIVAEKAGDYVLVWRRGIT